MDDKGIAAAGRGMFADDSGRRLADELLRERDEEFIVFDPDMELEWELDQLGLQVVFTPEPPVTAGHGAFLLAMFGVFAVLARRMRDVMFGPLCLECGGRLAHRKDCSLR